MIEMIIFAADYSSFFFFFYLGAHSNNFSRFKITPVSWFGLYRCHCEVMHVDAVSTVWVNMVTVLKISSWCISRLICSWSVVSYLVILDRI